MKDCLICEEPKPQMLEETREALADIKAGHVVDGAEVMDWLETWGTDREKVSPKLHKVEDEQI